MAIVDVRLPKIIYTIKVFQWALSLQSAIDLGKPES